MLWITEGLYFISVTAGSASSGGIHVESRPCPSYFVFNMLEMFNYFWLIHLSLNCPKTWMCSALRLVSVWAIQTPSLKESTEKPSIGGQNRCRFKSWLSWVASSVNFSSKHSWTMVSPFVKCIWLHRVSWEPNKKMNVKHFGLTTNLV